jgi:asparagine synthase (glutamine-hydrolysing)
MCGIAGAFGPVSPPLGRVKSTLRLMQHRGPDGEGTFEGTVAGQTAMLLHTRLSIIDLDPRSNQPFEDDNCVLVFNGEIYNFVELRQSLRNIGHVFHTNSDTEVLLRAYLEYGVDCVQHLEGMWAFALLDNRRGSLFLSRDPFGEKPLFLMTAGESLFFGSETKFLSSLSGKRLSPNFRQIRRNLVNGYKSLHKQPETFLEDVWELPPGTNYILGEGERSEPARYWNLEYRPTPMSLADAIEGTKERLNRSLEIRLRADVPLAFCLSGGIDSGALAAIAVKKFQRQVDAFSIVDSDPRYNEMKNMTATVNALGCRHHVINVSKDDFFSRMERLVACHDAPVATISYYVHSQLSEAVAKAGFKIAISGTGADELFTGYYDHYNFWLAEAYKHNDHDRLLADWRSGYGATVRNPILRNPMIFHERPQERGHIYLDREIFNKMIVDPFEEQFSEETYCNSPLRNRMLNELHHEVVPVILHEDDLNSMAVSIENRSPYLDRSLSSFLNSVPGEHLVQDGRLKHLLRAATEDYVPDEVRLDRNKRGFNASIDSLVDRSDSETRERLLENSPVFDLVDRDQLETFIDGDMSNNSSSKFLFSFVSTKLFLESDLLSATGPHA